MTGIDNGRIGFEHAVIVSIQLQIKTNANTFTKQLIIFNATKQYGESLEIKLSKK